MAPVNRPKKLKGKALKAAVKRKEDMNRRVLAGRIAKRAAPDPPPTPAEARRRPLGSRIKPKPTVISCLRCCKRLVSPAGKYTAGECVRLERGRYCQYCVQGRHKCKLVSGRPMVCLRFADDLGSGRMS
jgi:hypothetical protein